MVQAKEQVRQLMHGKSNSKNNIKLQIVSVTSHLALGEIDQFALLAWLIKVDRTLWTPCLLRDSLTFFPPLVLKIICHDGPCFICIEWHISIVWPVDGEIFFDDGIGSEGLSLACLYSSDKIADGLRDNSVFLTLFVSVDFSSKLTNSLQVFWHRSLVSQILTSQPFWSINLDQSLSSLSEYPNVIEEALSVIKKTSLL